MSAQEDNIRILIEAWKVMVARIPGSSQEHAGGVATILSHTPLLFFNISIPDRPVPDEQALRDALALAKEREKDFPYGTLFAFSADDGPAGWEAVAAEAGLGLMMNLTWMEATALLPPRRPAPALDIRRVADEAAARDLAMINERAYSIPVGMMEPICTMRFWPTDSYAFVGYVDGEAVSTAAALPVDGTMYIALVATLPDHQGKGYGEAVLRQAIEAAWPAMGVQRITLHASDMGQPVYRAMGFEAGPRMALLVGAGEAH